MNVLGSYNNLEQRFAFSPKSNLFVTLNSCPQKCLNIWNISDLSLVSNITIGTDQILRGYYFKFSDLNENLITARWSQHSTGEWIQVSIYDVYTSFKRLNLYQISLLPTEYNIDSIIISENYVAGIVSDSIIIWDYTTNKKEFVLKGINPFSLENLKISPDTSLIASFSCTSTKSSLAVPVSW